MTRTLPLTVVLLCVGLTACGRLPPRAGADPLYDFDTVWFNDGVGGITPWTAQDREAVTAAVVDAEDRAAARWRGQPRAVAKAPARVPSSARPTPPPVAAAPRPTPPPVAAAPRPTPPPVAAAPRPTPPPVAAAPRPTPPPVAAAPRPTPPPVAAAPRPTPPPVAAAPPPDAAPRRRRASPDAAPRRRRASPDAAPPSPPRPARRRLPPASPPAPEPGPRTRPLLGDGSVPGELLAAAQRVLGVRDGFGDRSFLAHLLSVAAVDVVASAPRPRYNAAVWAELTRSGRTFEAATPEPGDLAFFHRVDDLDGDGSADDPFSAVAVVERVLPSGVILCIGEVHGEVRRFSLDPARPWAVRDEATGEEVNSPLRRRSLKDPPGTVVLAGGLLAGYARP
jgi:hypothetical protein